jgi:deoxyadenosine/deoxycytidine kinase
MSKMPITYDERFVDEKSLRRVEDSGLVEQPRYIAIEGPIGTGKTTLAEMLAEAFHSHILFERFEENPFLHAFYEDRRRLAFQTQIFFLLSRYRQQQDMLQTDLFYSSIVTDYMFEKDRIFAAINLTDDELKLYDQIERALGKTIPMPDVVIYLQSSVARLEENVRKRGRAFEKNLNREYLEELVRVYNDFFFHYRESRLIVVDTSTMDFIENPEHFNQLLKAILRSPHPPVEYLSALRETTSFELEG